MADWSVADIPDQTGRIAVVTGASNGIGYGTALALAGKGARVVLAARNAERGEAAMARIRSAVPNADLELRLLDLADLDSVARFADGMNADGLQVDLLINNAGQMMGTPVPTAQGHELHFGVNYLGHFALTLRLLPRLAVRPDARVVTISSLAHKSGRIDFDNLAGVGRRPFALYAQSKLANAMFALELDRRLKAAANPVLSVIAHPGFSGTNLATGMAPGLIRTVFVMSFSNFGQTNEEGVRPTLRAAVEPHLRGGEFFGPKGLFELDGAPVPRRFASRARDVDVASRLWSVSEQLTGLRFPG